MTHLTGVLPELYPGQLMAKATALLLAQSIACPQFLQLNSNLNCSGCNSASTMRCLTRLTRPSFGVFTRGCFTSVARPSLGCVAGKAIVEMFGLHACNTSLHAQCMPIPGTANIYVLVQDVL